MPNVARKIYRSRLYVAFDGDVDMRSYRMLRAWRDNKNIDFRFSDAHDLNIARDTSLPESIKAQLRVRMQNSKTMLLLVGPKTKYIRGYIPWEIKYARHLNLPIIVANLNHYREYDADLCPRSLEGGKGAVHVAFRMRIIKHALEHWPAQRRSEGASLDDDWYSYADEIYRKLGIT